MKQYIYHILALAFLCLHWGCQSKSRETLPSQRIRTHEPPQTSYADTVTVKKYIASCYCGDSTKLIIETLYKSDTDSVSHFQKILILNQDMSVVYKEDTASLPLPFLDSMVISGNETLFVKKTALYEVKCISNGKRYIYKSAGVHWFDPPHEFYGLCSTQGEWLWYYYGSMHKAFKKYGNHEKYEQEFGSEINSLKNMMPVLPEFY